MKRYLQPTPDTPERAAIEARAQQAVTAAGAAWLRDAAGARQAQLNAQQAASRAPDEERTHHDTRS